MSVTTYTTVNGQILSQSKDGVVHHFVSDPLGSVVMVRDNAGNTVYEAEYEPYGNVQSETGTNPSEFGYVGTLGYAKDSATSLYVRARYLLTNLGRWLTKDPLWPSEPGFVYAGAMPISLTDPFVLKIDAGLQAGCSTNPCDNIKKVNDSKGLVAAVAKCMFDKGFKDKWNDERVRKMLALLAAFCDPNGKGPKVCNVMEMTNFPVSCFPKEGLWASGRGGFVLPVWPVIPISPQPSEGVCGFTGSCINDLSNNTDCGCLIMRCPSMSTGEWCRTGLIHELIHCSGFTGVPGYNSPPIKSDFVYKLPNCIPSVLASFGASKRRGGP